MDEILLRIPEAARRYDCSRAKLYEMISSGLIPVVKLGPGHSAGVRVRLSDLERFAASNAKFRGRDRNRRIGGKTDQLKTSRVRDEADQLKRPDGVRGSPSM